LDLIAFYNKMLYICKAVTTVAVNFF